MIISDFSTGKKDANVANNAESRMLIDNSWPVSWAGGNLLKTTNAKIDSEVNAAPQRA